VSWRHAGRVPVLPSRRGPLAAGPAFLLLAAALIGTTITPSVQFYLAAAVADKGIGPADYGKQRVDAVSGAIFADLISIFIIVATAAAINPAPLAAAQQAAQALRPWRAGSPASSSRSACSARPRSPRPSAPNGPSATASARPGCSWACSPARS
jgi:Mn2+/Fe2+ NRAMP family transporter